MDGGRSRAYVDVANARSGIAIAAYERALQSGSREVSDGLVARRWLIERIVSQQRELEAQRVRANLVTLRYHNWVASYLEVLDAERELFTAEMTTAAHSLRPTSIARRLQPTARCDVKADGMEPSQIGNVSLK